MPYRWLSLLVFTLTLAVVGFAQKGLNREKPDPLAKPDPTVKALNWRITPIKVAPRNPAHYQRYAPRGDFFPASGSLTVDVTNTPSYDSAGASCNVRLTLAVPSGKDRLAGIGWDVQITAYDPSWLSEAAVLITNVNGEGYILAPGAGNTTPGTSSFSSGGVNELCGFYGLPPLELPDGYLYLEFFETYDDFSDCGQDGNWDSGTLTFTFDTAPPFTGYDEVGDAGDLPESAQATPSGALTGIRGTLSPGDADMYAIYITDPFAFSASTQCTTFFDTQLFLFDANGNPVSFDDDAPEGGLQSRLDGSCIPGAGLYYLVVSAYDRDAADCNGAELWADTPFSSIRCPDGAGSGRIGSWTGSHSASGTYIVSLTGAEGASPGDPDDCPPFSGWDEFANGGGDAGDLPETAQSTGSDTIPAIRGQLDTDDVDMYAIYIEDPSAFSATTVGGATFDTQLWLFDANGKGVVANDDSGGLQSRIDNTAGCITAPGVYYLAISRYARNAAGCEGGGIWAGRTNNCPDGAEATSRVASWFNSTSAAGQYLIFLTGARGASAGDPNDCSPPGDDQWDEQVNGGGDAGDSTSSAQPVYRSDMTPCQSPVTRIRGVRADTADADVYVICITDPNAFSASTVGLAGFDTQLWLFRCDGTGVVHNDDSGSLQSRIDNSTGCLSNLQAGTYLLAITGYNQDPVDANGNTLWNNTPFGEVRCPDGPGAANPFVGWSGSGGSGNYGIALTGAYFVSAQGCEGGGGCEGDVNNDGRVDDADLLEVLFNFGCFGFCGPSDVNEDGYVDDADLLVVLFNFGCGA
ncbi:MAG: DVUA0089 family protein [Fimbriimonadales bacterium]